VRADGGQEPGADTGHSIELLQPPERPPGLAIGYDGLGKRRTHAGEAGELARRGPVDVDPLTPAKGAGEREDAVPVSQGRLGREGREKLDLPRRLARTRDPPPHALAGEPQGHEEEEGAALGG
jgi:hypothetical protein